MPFTSADMGTSHSDRDSGHNLGCDKRGHGVESGVVRTDRHICGAQKGSIGVIPGGTRLHNQVELSSGNGS